MIGSTIFYGCVGGGLAFFSNAIRKLPLMRRPWEHVALIAAGAYMGSNMEELRASKKKQLEEALAERAALSAARDERIAARKIRAVESGPQVGVAAESS